MFDRPAQAGQAGGGQETVPGEPFFEGLVLLTRAAEPLERGVLADEEGILWIPGVRADERCRATADEPAFSIEIEAS
ncbi:MAG TPA: hypothetical protein PKD47_11725 [Solirubrobacterales bacterium]|nr:hypothetical protein [Solirubrobacterales bacterium]